MEHAKLSLCLAGALLALPAEAKLPWGSQITQPALKSTDSVPFDPLSLLAVLWNPRATASAGRLYMQPDLANFRWPHLLQIGAVLTPGHASDEQLWIDTSSRGYVRADNRHAGCHDEYWCVKESVFKTACYE